MGVGLFKLTGGAAEFSSDGTYTNPLLWEVSPDGGTLEAKYYLRMEDTFGEYCTGGTMWANDTDLTTDETSWITFAEDVGGGPGTYGPTFSFEIPLGSEVPVWINVNVPSGVELGVKTDLRISTSAIVLTVP